MAIIVNTTSWRQDSTEQHNGFYDYSLSEYTGGKNLIKIICPLHGVFEQRAGLHKAGYGCKACANSRSGGTQRLNNEQFIKNATEDWGDLYDYSLVQYVASTKKVEIICREHGSFWMTPGNHTNKTKKQGCPVCARIRAAEKTKRTQEEFLTDSKEMHGELYDYKDAIYLGDKVKVAIGCRVHGIFHQVPSNHLQGQGCPKCKKCGYQVAKPGHLYVLSNGDVTKVGITNRAIKKRVEEVARSGGPKLEVVSSHYFADGEIPPKLESLVHKYLHTNYEQVSEVFDGSTECFKDVDLEALLSFIVPLASANNLAANVETNNRPHNI